MGSGTLPSSRARPPVPVDGRLDARRHGPLAGDQVEDVRGKARHHLAGEPLEALALLVAADAHQEQRVVRHRGGRLADGAKQLAARGHPVARRLERGHVHAAGDHVHLRGVRAARQALVRRGAGDGEDEIERAEDAAYEPLVPRRGERHVAPHRDGGQQRAPPRQPLPQCHRERGRDHRREEDHVDAFLLHHARDGAQQAGHVGGHAVRRGLPAGLQHELPQADVAARGQGGVQAGGHALHPAHVAERVAPEREGM